MHVRPELAVLGAEAAGEAEAAWTALAALLPAPAGRIDLVLSDDLDESNGYASTYPQNTIVIFAVPPAGDVQLEVYDRWLRLVITHELAHLFHLDYARGWWGFARKVFGRAPGFFPNEYTPTWLIEGTAVFYESRVTGVGRLDGGFHNAVVGAQVAEGEGLPIDAAGSLSPRWPTGIRPYAFGASFFRWLAEQRGDSVVRAVIENVGRRPFPYLQLDGALVDAAGMSFSRAWSTWMDSLRTARGRLGGQAVRRLENATTLVCCERVPAQPRVSADGRRILFLHADGRETARVAIWDRDAGTYRALARVNNDGGMAWQGDDVLLSQLEFDGPYRMRSDLYRINPSGAEQRLTRQARLKHPDVDATGAIVAVRLVPGGTELVVLEGDSTRVLVAAQRGVEWVEPRFAPDGRTLAAIRVVGGRHDLVLLARDGTLQREVTGDVTIDQMPAFSPDGARLLWTREIDGVMQIVGIDLAGGGATRYTHSAFGAWAPAPAGDSLFYLAYHHDGYRVSAGPLSGEPWTVPAPDGAAPDTAAPRVPVTAERGYHGLALARPRYWLPSLFWVKGGAFAGALTSGADPLQRHQFLADVGVGTGSVAGSWRGAFYYLYAGLPPAVLDASFVRDQLSYLTTTGGSLATACCLASDAADVGLTVTRRRWRTPVVARIGWEYERLEQFRERVGANATLGIAHTLGAPHGISSHGGWRFSSTVRRRWKQASPLASTELSGAVVGYAPGPMARWARSVGVGRAAYGFITGTDSLEIGVGGVSGGAYDLAPGVGLGTGSRRFPVRGYPGSYLAGRRVAAFTAEVRVPLAMVGRGPGVWPVTLDRVSLSAFADAGVAWSARHCPAVGGADCARWISSAGSEVVVDAGVPFDFPVRLRVGAAWRFTLKSGGAYVAFGSSF